MTSDQTAYVASPFIKPNKRSSESAPTQGSSGTKAVPELPSDQPEDSPGESQEALGPPDLPSEYAPTAQPSQPPASIFYIPRGRISGLNLVGEALGWLMAWGTVGFFRAYLPPPIVAVFDYIFTPWGMAGGTLISTVFVGQLLNRYRIKIAAIRRMAFMAIEYGECHQRAEAQTIIDRLLTEAEEKTEKVSSWIVSWLTALGCLFIIGAFY